MSSAASDVTTPQYRSISWAAVLAFALGLASALTLVTPLCLVIALAAAGLALIALWQIGANPEILSGRGLATTALFLAVFFAIFAPARLLMRSRVMQQRGQELAEAFLDLLQEGKTREAHQLSNLKFRTPSIPNPGDPIVDPEKLSEEDFRGFEETQTIRNIKRINHKFTYSLEAVEPSLPHSDGETLVLRYRIVPDASTGKRPFPVWIAVARSIDGKSGIANWRIAEMQHIYKAP